MQLLYTICLLAVLRCVADGVHWAVFPPKTKQPLDPNIIRVIVQTLLPPILQSYANQLCALMYVMLICCEEIMFRSWPQLYYGHGQIVRCIAALIFGILHITNVWRTSLLQIALTFSSITIFAYLIYDVTYLPFNIVLHLLYNYTFTWKALRLAQTRYEVTPASQPKTPVLNELV